MVSEPSHEWRDREPGWARFLRESQNPNGYADVWDMTCGFCAAFEGVASEGAASEGAAFEGAQLHEGACNGDAH